MKKLIPGLLLLATTASAIAKEECGKVDEVSSTSKFVMVEKKHGIARPDHTIHTNVQMGASVWALTGDQLALAITAFDQPNKYQLCIETNVYSLERPGYQDPMAMTVRLKKIK